MNITDSLTREEINRYPLFSYTGKVSLIKSSEALAEALEHIAQEKILGFDTETRPSFTKGISYDPSLIQLACSDIVYIIQLKYTGFSDELASLLASKNIIKSGVAIAGDMQFLQALHRFNPAGLVDLSEIAKKKDLKVYGLRGLAALLLNKRISKGARCSNWGTNNLTRQQIVYAATDAWISRTLYLQMQKLGLLHKLLS